MRSCVAPGGFEFLVHRPGYRVVNRRATTKEYHLGVDEGGSEVTSRINFPAGDIEIEDATVVFEVPNPFPFWGATFILGDSAAARAQDPRFSFTPQGREEGAEFDSFFMEALKQGKLSWDQVPRHIKLSLAQNSSDPELLSSLARWCAGFETGQEGKPQGLLYRVMKGRLVASKRDKDIYETVANNPALPDELKRLMVLNPGVQGTSPIVGEYSSGRTHVWEYLRANSYVPWGHFASNMAEDAVRYSVLDLTEEDMRGLRHLYYQRIYTQMAHLLGLLDGDATAPLGQASEEELEELRLRVARTVDKRLEAGEPLPFSGTLWGWNYGYDISSSGYRLHASHQQIHNQYALVPSASLVGSPVAEPFSIGMMVRDFCSAYAEATGCPFFETYLSNIAANTRMDGADGLPSSLVVHEDGNVMVVIPKAQRSQGEVQVIAKQPVGNILEADTAMRRSLDTALLVAVQGLAKLGAEMVTLCEASKPFSSRDGDQRLFYYLLPRHPYSPGSFSERQQRWVTGHFPEDFAEAMRRKIDGGHTI